MPFGYYDPQPAFVAQPRPKEYVATPQPPPRRVPAAPTAERQPPAKEREPEVVRVSLPGPDELGITVRETVELPPPDQLGINPK